VYPAVFPVAEEEDLLIKALLLIPKGLTNGNLLVVVVGLNPDDMDVPV
jgi:hypothetical protein